MLNKYVPPEFEKDAFNCPNCGAYAHQTWYKGALANIQVGGYKGVVENLRYSMCTRCKEYALWREGKMIYPISTTAPLPAEDMPENVKADFLEARNIVNPSPRGAAALLRLALQELMPHLGEKGKSINDDIAELVKKGLPAKLQQALDGVRVIGNEAVHPGQIDLRDDPATAAVLFDLVNMIVDVMITQPKKVEGVYQSLPQSKRDAIKKRDGTP